MTGRCCRQLRRSLSGSCRDCANCGRYPVSAAARLHAMMRKTTRTRWTGTAVTDGSRLMAWIDTYSCPVAPAPTAASACPPGAVAGPYPQNGTESQGRWEIGRASGGERVGRDVLI